MFAAKVIETRQDVLQVLNYGVHRPINRGYRLASLTVQSFISHARNLAQISTQRSYQMELHTYLCSPNPYPP